MDAKETELPDKTTVSKSRDDKKQSKLTSFRRNLGDPLFRGKLLYTMGIYLTSISGGWIVGIKGPAFIDLQQLVGVGTSKGAAFFTAAGIGGVVGSLVGGALYDRFNEYLVLFVSALLYGVTCAVIPLCSTYWLMVFMFLMHEMSTGAVRSGSNVEIVKVWGPDSAKLFMQGLHFAFSLGAAISPFSIEPFLSEKAVVLNATTTNTTTTTTTTNTESRLFWGFLIAAVFGVVSSLSYLVKYITTTSSHEYANCVNPPDDAVRMYVKDVSAVKNKDDDVRMYVKDVAAVKNKDDDVRMYVKDVSAVKNKDDDVRMYVKDVAAVKNKDGDIVSVVVQRPSRAIPKLVIIGAVVLFFCLYFFLDEVEDTTPSFMAIFVVKQFKMNKKYGASVTGAFFAAYCTGRGLGMLVIGFLTHLQLFSICCVSLILGQTCLFLSGWFLWEWGLWVGVIIIGLAISVIFPASLTWTEKELTHLSGKLVGLVYIALYVGGLANPQIIGYTMEVYHPMWYSYVLLTETVCFVVVFGVLMLYVRNVIGRYKTSDKQ